MTRRILTAAAAPLLARGLPLAVIASLGLALAGCEKGKPRHPPPDPMAQPAAASVTTVLPSVPISSGLPKLPQMAGFSLDRVGDVADPLNKQPAVTAAGAPVVLMGFGFNPVTKTPAKGVDVVIDGKAYGTAYGAGRNDVAAYFKAPALTNVGFSATLPPGTLAPGPHTAVVRVVAADGSGYFDSLPIAFQVK